MNAPGVREPQRTDGSERGMTPDAADPVLARYLIAPVIIDGPVLPPGEAEVRIVGTIAAAEDVDMPGQDPEPLRFRVTDWAGPYLPQDVVFEHRVLLPRGDAPSEYGPIRRSNDGKQGYADAFHTLTAAAADWQQEGRSFAEFVSWMQATATLVGRPSWKTTARP